MSASEVQLNSKVVLVELHQSESGGGSVTITTESEQKRQFDGAVMTTPLGWLKVHKHAFTPSLEPRLLQAVDSISVGHLEKVYITFPRAFWMPLNTAEDEEPAGYSAWLSPDYTLSTNPHKWPQEAYNLAAFEHPNSHPTLLFYMHGAQSVHLIALVHDLSPTAHHSTLRAFFHPYYSRLPNYDQDDLSCEPVAILSTAWCKDELAGYGSYCNFQVGMTEADRDVEVLRQGFPEGRLWFAGEHTAPFEEMGTATGAYLSGERAARQVVEVLGRKNATLRPSRNSPT
jgi:monoamine oxidase